MIHIGSFCYSLHQCGNKVRHMRITPSHPANLFHSCHMHVHMGPSLWLIPSLLVRVSVFLNINIGSLKIRMTILPSPMILWRRHWPLSLMESKFLPTSRMRRGPWWFPSDGILMTDQQDGEKKGKRFNEMGIKWLMGAVQEKATSPQCNDSNSEHTTGWVSYT